MQLEFPFPSVSAQAIRLRFDSLDDIIRHYRLTLPKPHPWRLVLDPLFGHINGLDNFHGSTVATNGVFVLMIDENDMYWLGHLDWFVPDESGHVEFSDLWARCVATHDPTKKPAKKHTATPKVKKVSLVKAFVQDYSTY